MYTNLWCRSRAVAKLSKSPVHHSWMTTSRLKYSHRQSCLTCGHLRTKMKCSQWFAITTTICGSKPPMPRCVDDPTAIIVRRIFARVRDGIASRQTTDTSDSAERGER